MSDTHVVTNQVRPLRTANPASSPVLIEALIQEGGASLDEVTRSGHFTSRRSNRRELADRNRPILATLRVPVR